MAKIAPSLFMALLVCGSSKPAREQLHRSEIEPDLTAGDGGLKVFGASFGRGGEEFLTTYRILDLTPKGRQENGPYHSLTDWVRPRNMYRKGGTVEPNGRYHYPSCTCGVHKQG